MKTETRSSNIDEDFVLAKNLGGGPLGLGDPDDRSLRKAEREIMIPQKMKATAKSGRCSGVVREFGECAKEKGLMMPFLCRDKARDLEKCLTEAYTDPAFIKACTDQYLEERSEFRRTGVKAKEQKKDIVL
ncbi:COX assembly mitochondrial protein homolog [Aplysia californica]|uniref:COX assembly mitochondrial protein n=1 Tax=Aplysia californica TaxID=6500 RepID=A0ABM1AFD2_APLCA|nr:COX assembly mitochondrial protein homolog [Aplysia californica]